MAEFQITEEFLRKRFDLLSARRDEINAVLEPIQDELADLTKRHAEEQEKIRSRIREVRDGGEYGPLGDIERERGLLAKALPNNRSMAPIDPDAEIEAAAADGKE